jgi:hypothetical protein
MRKLLITLALIGGIACGGETATGPSTIAGTYSLRTLNGSSLPLLISLNGADTYELTDDILVLTTDSTFTQTSHFRATTAGQITTPTTIKSGVFSLSGTQVTFGSAAAGGSTGTWSGNTLTVVQQTLYQTSTGVYAR